MATIAERIQFALEKRRMKQVDLVNLTGIGKSSISTYLTGEYEPKQKNLYQIASALSVSPAWLMGLDVPMEGKPYIACVNALSEKAHRIGRAFEKADPPVQRTVEVALEPYMEEDDDDPPDNIIQVDFNPFKRSEQCASAGKGVYLDDESMITINVRTDALPRDFERNPGRYFGVPVDGNSMEPRYHDGDLLIVSKEPVNVGQVGVFTMGGEGYVKMLGRGVLHSLNSEYDDIELTEDVVCNGKVIGVLDPGDIVEE